ncbi:hypothetical protein CERZMDRAFT_103278 [Cercospora zeae-maydis SCOH1-5]|uniref:Uncharacterized protein n=1 Tax=Cercospora zeae-maydis SCOH1-5 TaxID=717836 RepID=A0A6A6EY34_9PEZI|nr:hypothetical protein CERZMDRAFT_103278 [Cercospora zeae-maydis SCOH1-5]
MRLVRRDSAPEIRSCMQSDSTSSSARYWTGNQQAFWIWVPHTSRDPCPTTLHSMTTSVMETCPRAEALGCLDKVAWILIGQLLESLFLGQCITQALIKFLKLAIKVRNKDLYFMACVDGKLAKNWFSAAAYRNGLETWARKKLLEVLLNVQLCRRHMMMTRPKAGHRGQGWSTRPLEYCSECIARTYFGEWLAEQITCYAYKVPDQSKEAAQAEKETLEDVLTRLQGFATTAMPCQIFGQSSNAHKTLANDIGLQGDSAAVKDIKSRLDICVMEAATVIQQAFKMSKTEMTEETFPTLSQASKVPRKDKRGKLTSSPSAGVKTPVATTLPAAIHPAQPTTVPTHSFTPAQQPPSKQKLPATNLSPPSSNHKSRDLRDPPEKDPSWKKLLVNFAETFNRTDDLDEARLPQDLLDAIDGPRHERWSLWASPRRRCCGVKKAAMELFEGHQCAKVNVSAIFQRDDGMGGEDWRMKW